MESTDVKALAKALAALVGQEHEVRVTLRLIEPVQIGQALVAMPIRVAGAITGVSEDGRLFTLRGTWNADAKTARSGEQTMLMSDVAFWTILGDVVLAAPSIVRPS